MGRSFRMMYALSLLVGVLLGFVQSNPAPSSTAAPQPAYPTNHPPQQPPQDAPYIPNPYVQQLAYPYAAEVYGPQPAPYDPGLYPAANYPVRPGYYMSSVIPALQNALRVALRLFAKVGLFLIGGVALLLVGGVFTTAVCSLTPICTITFAGLGGLDKETMRSLMTPERISEAASLINDAIGKYQRLQRAVS